MAKIVSWKPLHFGAGPAGSSFYRADLRLWEVDHGGATYEARVFLNNLSANEATPTSLDSGYAGSFYVFGHGGCFGQAGHCNAPLARRPYDLRPDHPLTPITKTLTITAALQRALASATDVTVTIVPIVKTQSSDGKYDSEDVLHFKSLEIVTYAS